MSYVLYYFAKIVFIIYFKLFKQWKIIGKDNLDIKGPLIVMANHIHFLDPPLVGSLLNRRVYFMAKEELFKNPLFGWALKKVGAFPVKRGRPDRRSIKQAFKVLEEGKVLGIFPEGTRHKQGRPGKAQPGAIMIALKSKAPILPIGIKIDSRGRVNASIGKPFILDEYYDQKLSKDEMKEVGKYIMEKIKDQISIFDY